jgi:NAD(P)-dependent dehydrogenase (short-subunit alcohol dehydrogenase family)
MVIPRIVIITGATGRLGEHMARVFLEAGDHIVLSGRNGAHLAGLQQQLAGGDCVEVAPADVSLPKEAHDLVAGVVERHGRLDCLVHLVGQFDMANVADASPALWTQLMTTNAFSAAYLCQAALPAMMERGYGKVVFVSSLSVPAPAAGLGPYAASKAALEAIAKAAAQEAKDHGVNVNVASISTLDSPEARASLPGPDPARLILPDDLAATIFFLCSEAARAINGAVIPVLGTGSIEVKVS